MNFRRNMNEQSPILQTVNPNAIDNAISRSDLLPMGIEPLYTPMEVAAYLRIDVSTVRRMFNEIPGAMKIESRNHAEGKRPYNTVRIPLSVVRAFIAQRLNLGDALRTR